MEIKVMDQCSYCNSTNIGVGYQLGQGQLFADPYAYQAGRECSNIEHLLCKDCGSILHSRVIQTNVFHQYGQARQEALRDYIDTHGILLCNENPDLPSLCSLGYNMENIIGLIEHHQVVYCKAFKKRSSYLSVKAYQLLKRTRTLKELYPEAKRVYHEIKGYDYFDKEEIKKSFDMEKKVFDRAFDFLLENLYITAYAGKRINPNWYSYLYCSMNRFEKEVTGLHFNGNAKEALWKLVGSHMSEKDFINFCK